MKQTKTRSPSAHKDVEFVLEARDAKSAAVVGSFNDWDPTKTPMQEYAHGMWRTKVPLPVGRYEYLFVLNGKWIGDPRAIESAPNPYGGRNSVVVV